MPKEEIEYLEEVLQEYTRFVDNIGHNGLAANLVLYYRTELQEVLTDLQGRAPLERYWRETVALDEQLKKKKTLLLNEIGWENYRIERASVNPPKAYWWWYLDQGLIEPGKPGPIQSAWNWLNSP